MSERCHKAQDRASLAIAGVEKAVTESNVVMREAAQTRKESNSMIRSLVANKR